MYSLNIILLVYSLYFVTVSSITVTDHILSDNYIISSEFGSVSLPTLNTSHTTLGDIHVNTITNGTATLSQFAPHFLNGIVLSLNTTKNENDTMFSFEYQSGSTGKVIEADMKVTLTTDRYTEINRGNTTTVYSGTLMTMLGSGFYPGDKMAHYKLTNLEISFQYVFANTTYPDDNIELTLVIGGWTGYVEPGMINMAGNLMAQQLLGVLGG